MKRCWFKSTPYMVLVLTSLLFFIGCGMPTYLNLDGEVTLSGKTPDEGQTISAEITVSSTAASKLTEHFSAGKGPSVKLFYVLSSQPYHLTSPITNKEQDTGYKLSWVDDLFNTIYRTTQGNGRPWSPEDYSGADSLAPGYYLYTDKEGTLRQYSVYRPEDLYEEPAGILVGSFAKNETISDQRASFEYGTSPEMDIPIKPSNFTNGFNFTITKESIIPTEGISTFAIRDKSSYLLKVLTSESSPRTIYLTDYRKHAFPNITKWSKENFSLQYVSQEDSYFYHNLTNDYNLNTNLYLHVYGAVYAGEGEFTNIYWSRLNYLGYILLD